MAPMVTTGPGYAIFNDLRRRMGISSSQPVPTSSRDVNVGAGPSPSSPEPKSRFASEYTNLTREETMSTQLGVFFYKHAPNAFNV